MQSLSCVRFTNDDGQCNGGNYPHESGKYKGRRRNKKLTQGYGYQGGRCQRVFENGYGVFEFRINIGFFVFAFQNVKKSADSKNAQKEEFYGGNVVDDIKSKHQISFVQGIIQHVHKRFFLDVFRIEEGNSSGKYAVVFNFSQ